MIATAIYVFAAMGVWNVLDELPFGERLRASVAWPTTMVVAIFAVIEYFDKQSNREPPTGNTDQ